MPSHEPTDVHAEFEIEAGSYVDTYAGTDLAERVRGNDAVRITRGLIDQQSTASATQANLTLNNADALFTEDNPGSPLFGKIGQNTRMRLGVQKDGTWDEYLRMPDFDVVAPAQKMSTADKASLDITGDIDVRMELTPFYARGRRISLAGKWDLVGNNRSWFLEWRNNGQLALATSPDGTLAATLTDVCSVAMDEHAQRIAIRVTLDVNNGAAGRTYVWYTADTIAGPWTQIATTTTAGTTSIFNGNSQLEIGSANNASGPFLESRPMGGKVHAFELRSGIAGTLVADFKPAGRGVGQGITWADACASPNTWAMTGDNIRLASDRIRISGELSSLPDTWDKTGNDVYVPVTLAGALQRYSSNKSPLRGAIYRNYSKYTGITGYWPMEDQSGATQAANAIAGGQAGSVVECTFGATQGLDGSTGSVTMNSAPNVSSIVLRAKPTSSTGYTSFTFYFRLDSLPAAGDQVLATVQSFGTAPKWTIAVSNVGFAFTAYDLTNTVVDTGSTTFGTGASPLDQWIGMQLQLTQEGANVRWETLWHAVGSDTFYTHFLGGDTFAGGFNAGFRSVTFGTPDSAFAGAQIAHAIFSNVTNTINTTRFADVSKGYAGELFGARLIRLSVEENVFFEWLGDLDDTGALGPQPADTLFNIFSQGAAVDGGIFVDIRDLFGFKYIARNYLGNRLGLELDYGASQLADTPQRTADGKYTVNDYTATRPSGSSARYVADDGRRKSVSDPPTGVGRYERSGAFNTATDAQLDGIAQFQVALGTVDRRRIPNLVAGLHRTQIFGDVALLDSVISEDCGDPVTLTGLAGSSAPMPPEDQRMITFGYTETIGGFTWDWTANTVPWDPYVVPIIENPNGSFPRLDTDLLNPSVTDGSTASGATSIVIATPWDVPAWCTTAANAAEFPFDAMLGGETVTVTAASTTAPLDGTFESGVSGWTGASCTIAQSAVFAFTGSKSALMTVTGTPTQATMRPTAGYRVSPGDTIGMIMWVRSTGALADVRATLDWYTSGGVFISKVDAAGALAAGTWVPRYVTGVAPALAAFVFPGATMAGSPATGSLLYVDGIKLNGDSVTLQTLTVTRSVNGIVKAHDSDTPISLAESSNLGMSA